MATYVIFNASPDPLLTEQAAITAKESGLTVHSARSGALRVTGAPAKVQAAAKRMPGGDWEVTAEQATTSIPEKRPQPHRRLRVGGATR